MNLISSLQEMLLHKRLIVVALTHADFQTVRDELSRETIYESAPSGADQLLGVPLRVIESRRSYVVEDTYDGPLIHHV